mmetsp:Transcript_26907/g.57936  ORF Transcript_26907/g.57936 Transcript_26907/m.57936 type:complete len:89 (-) Transcript_26907:401-667(-)
MICMTSKLFIYSIQHHNHHSKQFKTGKFQGCIVDSESQGNLAVILHNIESKSMLEAVEFEADMVICQMYLVFQFQDLITVLVGLQLCF